MQIKAMLGPELCDKATNGAKRFEVTVSNDVVEDVFGHGFSKSLRYGSTLELVKVLSRSKSCCNTAHVALFS